MTVTLQPRYGALMMTGHGAPLYVAAAELSNLAHGQAVPL